MKTMYQSIFRGNTVCLGPTGVKTSLTHLNS